MIYLANSEEFKSEKRVFLLKRQIDMHIQERETDGQYSYPDTMLYL